MVEASAARSLFIDEAKSSWRCKREKERGVANAGEIDPWELSQELYGAA